MVHPSEMHAAVVTPRGCPDVAHHRVALVAQVTTATFPGLVVFGAALDRAVDVQDQRAGTRHAAKLLRTRNSYAERRAAAAAASVRVAWGGKGQTALTLTSHRT
jgi:hypothetical protein